MVTAGGDLACAGDDGFGQLGNGPGNASSMLPTVISFRPDLARLDAGSAHTVAVDTSGTLFCWGDNSSRQCAQSNVQTVETPIPINMLPTKWASASAGASHTCAIDMLARVFCWGSNQASQVGAPGGGDITALTNVTLRGQLLHATIVSAGGLHTCAVSGGQVYCWGKNDMQQICQSVAMPQSAEPNPCPIPNPVLQVGASASGACALDDDDGVHCWGHTSLVDGQAVGWYGTPQPVYDNAQQLSVGTDHACVLLHGGEIVCWGRNDRGQVNGMAKPSEILPPTQVALP
jgi:alpha-tubulin suppressor-like RCC1 family protein